MQSLCSLLLLILLEHRIGQLILGLKFSALHVGTRSLIKDDLALDYALH